MLPSRSQRGLKPTQKPNTPAPRIIIAWSDAARGYDLPDTSRARLNAAARRAIRRCVREVQFASPPLKYFEGGEISVSFVSDAEIALLNAQYRHKNRPTDVLSWAQSEGELSGWPVEDGASASLGDIVFSVETAVRQARERLHSIETELLFLAVHGTLHLLGYDHQTATQRRIMWRWQDRIVEKLSTRKVSVAR